MDYCDDCGEPLKKGTGNPITHLPFDVASANEGESAILCDNCLKEHGYGICYCCHQPVELGAGESGECDKCGNVFHTACDEGWNKGEFGHYCSACLP